MLKNCLFTMGKKFTQHHKQTLKRFKINEKKYM